MQKSRLSPDRIILLGCYAIAALLMWFTKAHYSRAEAEELRWILNPVAAVVQIVDGISYAWKTELGWVRNDGFVIIAPACAGVNFMIMVFGLSCVGFFHRLKTTNQRLVWLTAAVGGAYLLAVGVNCLRILVSIFFYENHFGWGWLTPQRLHRGIGVAIYFPVLGLYYAMLERIINKFNNFHGGAFLHTVCLPWQPLVWYMAGTVAVPLLHSIYAGNAGLNSEYCITVIGGSVLVWGLGSLGWYFIKLRKVYASRCPDSGR